LNAERIPLLLVEDDPGLQKQLKWAFPDFSLLMAGDRQQALNLLRLHQPAVAILDLGLPPDPDGIDEGLKTLQEILGAAPRTKVIVVTGNGEQHSGLRAVALGACDFYQKPFDLNVLKLIVSRALHVHGLEQQLQQMRESQLNMPLPGIIATDAAMVNVCRMIEKVAPTRATVLILGESGTGKELLARAVHERSERRAQPFVAINCAAIPENLLESELFGHEKGAFTGAVKRTIGKVESANEGTLFLDEIGDMPLPLQAKLLRFLQARVVERVGGREEIPVDVRVVCATNQALQSMIAEKLFRADLYHRISEVIVEVPPLRARPGAIVVLAHAILRQCEAAPGAPRRGFTEGAVAAMSAYAWPGNVRELENKVRGAAIMANGPIITAQELGLPDGAAGEPVFNLREIRARAEREALRQALQMTEGNISRAAELLGITRPTLYDLMQTHALRPIAAPHGDDS
jgi:two-component system, NtrC family, response regulator